MNAALQVTQVTDEGGTTSNRLRRAHYVAMEGHPFGGGKGPIGDT
jgi:hypothetical protein